MSDHILQFGCLQPEATLNLGLSRRAVEKKVETSIKFVNVAVSQSL